jgi:hypothetical protein
LNSEARISTFEVTPGQEDSPIELKLNIIIKIYVFYNHEARRLEFTVADKAEHVIHAEVLKANPKDEFAHLGPDLGIQVMEALKTTLLPAGIDNSLRPAAKVDELIPPSGNPEAYRTFGASAVSSSGTLVLPGGWPYFLDAYMKSGASLKDLTPDYRPSFVDEEEFNDYLYAISRWARKSPASWWKQDSSRLSLRDVGQSAVFLSGMSKPGECAYYAPEAEAKEIAAMGIDKEIIRLMLPAYGSKSLLDNSEVRTNLPFEYNCDHIGLDRPAAHCGDANTRGTYNQHWVCNSGYNDDDGFYARWDCEYDSVENSLRLWGIDNVCFPQGFPLVWNDQGRLYLHTEYWMGLSLQDEDGKVPFNQGCP